MSRSYTPFHRKGRPGGAGMTALVAAAAVVVIGGVAGAVTLTGGGHKNASLTSASASQLAVPGASSGAAAPAAASYAAAANVTPPVAATDCAAPSTFTYSGTLSATAPGTVKYQWVYSSGQPGPVQTVKFAAAGQHLVTGQTVTTKTAGTGWGEIKVISPVARTSDRAVYKLLCGGSTVGGVSATAAVTPAASTASCAPSVPSFTAAGEITVAKAEAVTYYWALSNGRDTTPATLAFAAPGTRAPASLTITPSAASGAGEAVLVVTSPVTTASAPAKYTLTCKTPASQPTTSAGTSTSNPTTPATNSATPGNSPTSPAGGQTSPAGGQTSPAGGQTSPAGSQTSPAGSQTSPASNPTTPAGNPSTPASNPTTAPPSSSGSGSMYIPGIDGLSATIELGYAVSNGTEVDGGVAPYTWSITGLPPGVTQQPQATGSTSASAIVGTATEAGTFPLTVTVTDSESPPQTLVMHYTFVVLQPNSEVWSVIGPGPLNGTVGVPFSTLFEATNGVTATFTVSSGQLPPGLSLNSTTGVLSGTPTERGVFNFYVIATDVATGATKQAGGGDFTVAPAS
jgi:hypothetical protein